MPALLEAFHLAPWGWDIGYLSSLPSNTCAPFRRRSCLATETHWLMLVHVLSFRFLCDNQKDLDELLDCLHPQGVRESQLKERLEKR